MVPRKAGLAGPALPWLGIILLYLLIRLPLLDVPLDRDEGAFGLIGQAILQGELPYRDIFDHKPPLVFYAYALGLTVFPATAAGMHLLLLLWNFATLLVVASTGRALAGRRGGLWCALVFTLASAAPSVQGFAATTEMLLLLPLAGSLRVALAALDGEGRRRVRGLLLSGALAAVACWFKQSAVFPLLIVPLFVAVRLRGGGAGRAVAIWLAGGVAASAVVVAPFLIAGAGAEFWYWSFRHSLGYAAASFEGGAAWLARGFAELVRDNVVPLAAAGGGALAATRDRERDGWVAPAFLALSTLSVLQSAFAYAHYFAQLAPALALAGGTGLARLERRFEGAAGRWVPFVALLLVCAVPLATRPWYWLRPDPAAVSMRLLGAQAFDAAPLLARHLSERTAPDDRLFLYGSEPQVAFLAGRRDANPFVMAYPLTGPWPRRAEFQARTRASVERHRPAYVILVGTRLSLLRAPDLDLSFEHWLTNLLRREYRHESSLHYSEATGFRILPAARAEGETILFELWRRRDAG